MNHIDKSESFDPEAFRRKVSEAKENAPGSSPGGADDNAVELNPLAQKIAQQFRQDTYSPAMITGLLRLGEFAALLTLGYFIHTLYVGVGVTALYVAVLVGGAAIGQVLGALVAVPVAASILIIVQKVWFPAQDAKVVDPDEEPAIATA